MQPGAAAPATQFNPTGNFNDLSGRAESAEVLRGTSALSDWIAELDLRNEDLRELLQHAHVLRKTTRRQIQDNPLAAVSIAAGVGLLAGLFIARRF